MTDPSAVQIRAATTADYEAYVGLFPELGVDDPIPSRERFAGELARRIVVAIDGGEVVGYALLELLEDTGYVRNIVSAPARRRRGVGLALMEHLREQFERAGATTWCLNVKPDNAAAIGLYERCGLRVAYRSCAMRVARDVVLSPPPADLVLAAAPVDVDPDLERRFGLPRGQLASARARASRRVLQLVRGGEPLGVAVFSDSIPGAFPFRLVDPSLAGACIAHLRGLAPEAAYIQVVVEDDAPLRDAVLALGGYVQLDMLHMRGALATG